MDTYANQAKENASQKVILDHESEGMESKPHIPFVDNRPEAIAQRNIQEIANNSPQAQKAAQFQRLVSRSPLSSAFPGKHAPPSTHVAPIQRHIAKNASATLEEEKIDLTGEEKIIIEFARRYIQKIINPEVGRLSKGPTSPWFVKIKGMFTETSELIQAKQWRKLIEKYDVIVDAINKWDNKESFSWDKQAEANVSGGKIKARTDVVDSRNAKHSFTNRYEGDGAEKSRWIQFVWIEVSREEPNKNRELLDGSVLGNIGEVPFTKKFSEKKIVIDALRGDITPYYDENGASLKASRMTEMQDSPTALSNFKDADAREFMEGKPLDTLVTYQLHFDSFLVKDDKTIGHSAVTITNQWKHVAMGPVIKTAQQTVTSDKKIEFAKSVSAMPGIFKKALEVRFANFSNIQ